MKLERVAKIKYSKYIDATSVRDIALSILKELGLMAGSKKEKAIYLAKYVSDNIRTTRGYDKPPYPRETLKSGYGTCFAKAVLLTSMLRAVGFTEDEVYTVVCKLHKVNSYLQGLFHALVIVRLDDRKLLVLNPSSTELYIEVDDIRGIEGVAKVYCLFNDKKGYIWIPEDS